MSLLFLLLFFGLLHTSRAVTCHQVVNGEMGSCVGDLCVISYKEAKNGTALTEQDATDQGCYFGGLYAELAGKCVRAKTRLECFCSVDNCNSIQSIAKHTTVLQLKSFICYANNTRAPPEYGTMSEFAYSSQGFIALWTVADYENAKAAIRQKHPNRYISATIYYEETHEVVIGFATGFCYTEDCFDTVLETRTKEIFNKTAATHCIINEQNSCMGDYCFIKRTISPFDSVVTFLRGCILVDDSQANSSYMVPTTGVNHFVSTTMLYCKTNDCNENFEKAWNSIGKPFPQYLGSSAKSVYPSIFIVFSLVAMLIL